MIGEREEVVIGILLIEILESFLRVSHRKIALEVDKLRLDRHRLRFDNSLEESTLLIVVCGYRRYLRLLNLMDRRVVPLNFEYRDITIGKEPVGKVDNLLLCHLRDPVDGIDFIGPFLVVDERIDKAVGTFLITAEALVERELHVVDDRRQEVVGKLSFLQLVYLLEHQLPNLYQSLSLFRGALQKENAVVMIRLQSGFCAHDLHRVVEIEVEESGLAVVEQMGDDVERIGLQIGSGTGTPTDDDVGCLQAYNGRVDVGSKLRQRSILGEGQPVVSFPIAKIPVNDRNGLIGIKIAGQTDGYIVWNVISVEIVFDVRDGRVLQMLLGTYRCLCSVGVMREKFLAQRHPFFLSVVGKADVVFLINGLKLSMESTDDHVLETVRLYPGPRLNLIGRDVFLVARHVL